MLHKIKKRKPVHNPTHSVWWRSPHLKNQTRASQTFMTSCSRIARLVNLIPLASILALALLGISMVSLPWDDSSNVAYAVDNEVAPLANTPSASLSYSGSLELSNSGSIGEGSNDAIITMSSNITVSATLINNYNLQISGTPELEGPSNITASTNTTSTAEGLDDNTWGYSWNNGSYKGITTSNTTIANDSIDSNGSVSYTKPLTFAAKFNKDAEAGHYKTKVNLSLTATPKTLTTYTLNYNNNGGGTVPSTQTISNYNNNHTFTINSTKPTRDGYEFLGYATTSTGSVAYQPGESITLQSSSPSQMLHAVWKAANLSSITTMQEMTKDVCAGSPTGVTYSLRDTRDNNSYTVRKFNDGRCWMTENLRIYNTTIYPADSDFDIPTSGIFLPNSSKSDFTDANVYTYRSYYSQTDNISAGNNTTTYYNWYTVTAGAGNANTATNGISVTTSICPKGWTLPTGGDNGGDFYRLTQAEGLYTELDGTDVQKRQQSTAKFRSTPYNFKTVGYVMDGYLGHGTMYTYWWSGTSRDTNLAYRLGIYNGTIIPGTGSTSRYIGQAVRCISAQ